MDQLLAALEWDMADGIQFIGKLLLIAGVIIAVVGGLLILSCRIPWLGKLPGDIFVQRKNFTFFFPLATSILLSIIITLVLWLLGRK
ncbi:MAG TPA: DUF2905 domain-containing protein [Thermodesulfovibrionales bacterium]|nr:DUF2905 domain-containing protein [Thermodesulfovibrionales bacterium]